MWKEDSLSADDIVFAEKWCDQAKELNLNITSPFIIEQKDRKFIYAVLIQWFGCEIAKNGILIRITPEEFVPEQCGEIWDVAGELGYCCTNMASDSAFYEKKQIIEMLNYYKWYGPMEKKPEWHTGEFYRELFPV